MRVRDLDQILSKAQHSIGSNIIISLLASRELCIVGLFYFCFSRVLRLSLPGRCSEKRSLKRCGIQGLCLVEMRPLQNSIARNRIFSGHVAPSGLKRIDRMQICAVLSPCINNVIQRFFFLLLRHGERERELFYKQRGFFLFFKKKRFLPNGRIIPFRSRRPVYMVCRAWEASTHTKAQDCIFISLSRHSSTTFLPIGSPPLPFFRRGRCSFRLK